MESRITLTASQFKSLVAPVLPFASRDDMLPVLNSVLVESRGKWLSSTATDRFRVGVKRIEKATTEDDQAAEWPAFRALVSVRSARSVLDLFKPRRHFNPEMTLTVDGERLIVEGSGGFDLFDASRFEHTLVDGEYPKTDSLFRTALATPAAKRVGEVGVNPAFLADFKAAAGSPTLRIVTGGKPDIAGKGNPLVVTDDDGFIGLLMPRAMTGGSTEDWTSFFADRPPAKKRATKKAVA
jgi:hypothetical protein